ncbi:hypothetical protein ACVWZR_005131 [Bradyrhizobium sp. i1.3.1]
MQIAFVKVEPSSTQELFEFFDLLEQQAKTGLRPNGPMGRYGVRLAKVAWH